MTGQEIFEAIQSWLFGRKPQLCVLPSGADALCIRSPGWKDLRDEFVEEHPRCECCGSKEDLEVHHIWPVHLFPQWELEWWNLMTLCRTCHFLFGHLKDWASYNESVVVDVKRMRKRIQERP